jgi:NAD(P) transhydrogenase subunit alpha
MNAIPLNFRQTGLRCTFALILLCAIGCGSANNAPDKSAATVSPTSNALPSPNNVPGPKPVAAEPIPENATSAVSSEPNVKPSSEHAASKDYSSLLFVFMLATFIGLGVILRVSRLLHTPLMSITNAISAIAVVGSIIVTGSEGNPPWIRFLGGVALFCSMTNIVSGFLITDRMLKMFKSPGNGGKR